MRDELERLGRRARFNGQSVTHASDDVPPGEATSEAPAERAWLFCLFSLVLVAALYAPVLGGPFIWDDRLLVGDSQAIRTLDVHRFFTQPFWLGAEGEVRSVAYFRPLVTLSFALDYRLHGDNPGGYHLTNIALHLLGTGLLFSLLRRRHVTVTLSFVLATAWACLPRLTEGAAWISGRTDVMASVLSILALWVYRPRSLPRFVLALVAAFAAILCKESGLAAFAALALLAWYERDRERFPLSRWAFIAGGLLLYAGMRFRASAFTLGDGMPLSPAVRLQTVLEAVGRYALMLLDPLQPRSYMGWVGRPVLPFVLLGAVVLIAVALLARRYRLATPETLAFVVLASVPLVLVLHLTKVPISVVTADRYLYLPAAALVVAGGPALQRLLDARRHLRPLPLLLLVVCSVRSYQRIADYTDDGRFWIEAVRRSPAEAAALGELASVAYRAGCYPEAFELYRRAVSFRDGRSASSLQNAALVAGIMGDHELATKLGDALVKYFPNRPALELRRATIALNGYEFAVARDHANRALSLDASHGPARHFLGLLGEIERGLPAVRSGQAPPGVGLMFDLRAFRYREAKAQLERMLDGQGVDEAALRSGIEFFIAKGDPKDAKPLLERYIARGNVVDAERLEAALQERQSVADNVRQQLIAFQASGDLPQAQTK